MTKLENRCLQGDCLEELPKLENKSIDMILTDLPYGITAKNKWDKIIPIEPLFLQFKRIIKPKGIIILTSVQPFTTQIIWNNKDIFRYELIFEKTRGTGFLNANRQPLRIHENILIFFKQSSTYNPQMSYGKPYDKSKYNGMQDITTTYNDHVKINKENKGKRFPTSIIRIKSMKNQDLVHPTQKPLQLFEYLIKTYSNEGDLILDCCAGSGTTAIACINTDRKYICIEKDKEHYKTMNERILNHSKPLEILNNG